LDQKYEIPVLDRLLKQNKTHKIMARTSDPACKAAVNWATLHIRRTVWKRELQRWETKLANCEVTLRAMWPFANALKKSKTKGTICNSWSLRPLILSNE
jgi:hypothetical protein